MGLFFYFGFVCIINDLFHLFYDVEIDSDKLKKELKEHDSFFRYITKRWIQALSGISYVTWTILGIMYFEPRQLFISLLVLTVVAPFIIFSIPDIHKQKKLSQLDNIISIVILVIILFKHFFLKIN